MRGWLKYQIILVFVCLITFCGSGAYKLMPYGNEKDVYILYLTEKDIDAYGNYSEDVGKYIKSVFGTEEGNWGYSMYIDEGYMLVYDERNK